MIYRNNKGEGEIFLVQVCFAYVMLFETQCDAYQQGTLTSWSKLEVSFKDADFRLKYLNLHNVRLELSRKFIKISPFHKHADLQSK